MQEDNKQNVAQEFKKRRYRHSLLLVLAGVGLGLTLVGLFVRPHLPLAGNWGIGIGAVLWFGIVAMTWIRWRCPACEAYLGRERNPQFCPACGIGLQEKGVNVHATPAMKVAYDRAADSAYIYFTQIGPGDVRKT
jgi:hypothetical protein